MGQEQSGEAAAYGVAAEGRTEEIEFDGGETLPKGGASLQKLLNHLDKQQRMLQGHIQRLSKNNNHGYIHEYTTITAGLDNPAKASRSETNHHLNRYNNIVAYDCSRVCLKPNQFTFNSDYINANFIPGLDNKQMYIASQGPVPDSFAGFWQMVWDENISVLVMVTNEVENGKLKCHRYWPDPSEGVGQYGEVAVQHSFQEVHPTFVVRHFSLSRGQEHRDVMQFSFTAWPDHGVPATTIELIHFRKAIREAFDPKKGPLLIHCSAGVGRTGTFLGLDKYMDLVMNGQDADVLQIVVEMRENRNFMVQSQIQFVYLYNVCLDAVSRVLQKIKRELSLQGLSNEERAKYQLQEIEGQLAWAESIKRQALEKQRNPDARASDGPVNDVATATKVSNLARKNSLMAFADPASGHWKNRENVPLDVKDKGYKVTRAADLSARLTALADTREEWVGKYAQAIDSWKVHQTEGGEVYDLDKHLTPLESRLQSLAGADEAFQVRHEGTRSAREENIRSKLAALHLRLESLQATVVGSESRWRAKLDSAAVNPAAEDHGKSVSTVSKLGGLTDRLNMLREEEDNWIRHQKVPRYSVEGFHSEVEAERKVLEERRQKQVVAKRRATQDAEEKARQVAAEDKARQKRMDEEKEAARKVNLMANMRRKSEQSIPAHDPATARKAKEDKQQKKEAEALAKKEKKIAAQKAKEEKKLEKQRSKENAKAKANKYLDKMRK